VRRTDLKDSNAAKMASIDQRISVLSAINEELALHHSLPQMQHNPERAVEPRLVERMAAAAIGGALCPHQP